MQRLLQLQQLIQLAQHKLKELEQQEPGRLQQQAFYGNLFR
jgi:hypothetical protein